MVILHGNSLGARQKDLNVKVNEAVKSNQSIDTYKPGPDKADVDILFEIDLAAKYKKVDYILEIFKSADILYISRALQKCLWLGDIEFDGNINLKNLQENVFPYTSIRMKKKLLCSLSMYVKDENRASEFHEYCMEEKLYNLATKFLLKTSESYKIEAIQQQSKAHSLIHENKEKYLVPFIGNSFTLADVYLKYLENEKLLLNDALYLLRHLYSVSDILYLDLLEKYVGSFLSCYETFRLGRRKSKSIMDSHKDRVLKSPLVYLKIINKNIMAQKSTVTDVKMYAVNLLPENVQDFWHHEFYETYKYILDVIPATERFSYIKQIFTEKYANKPFETCLDFHTFKFYNVMTSKEKEDWALQHVASGEELFGSGNDYKWYKFVNFDKAFDEVKNYILITQDSDKRLDMLIVLIDSAKSQDDLEKLMKYFYSRHVNETKYLKEHFLNSLIYQHKVWNYNAECWDALEKTFYSLDVFNKLNHNNCNSDYKSIALIYYILRKDVVLEVLKDYIDMDIISINRMRSSCGLDPEKVEVIFQYLLEFYQAKLEALSKETLGDDIYNEKILRYLELTLNLLMSFKKNKDSIPELIKTHIKLNWETVNKHSFFYEPEETYSEREIVKYLKNDVTQVITEFPKIKKYIEVGNHTNWLIRKLKIYFHHDIAQQYLQLVNKCLSSDPLSYSLVKYAVYTIFNLADESFKVNFLAKHVPTIAKIDHATISQNTLNIRRAICSVSCFSRPLLPMANILQFIKGDYVKFCLPIFSSYMMNLPFPQCIIFIESLLDKPLSIQKHGLHLAFICYSTENLITLIKDTWKKSNNVTLRMIVFKELFNKIKQENGQTQLALFRELQTLILDLHEYDDQEVYNLLINCYKMSYNLRGIYIATAWESVKKLPEKDVNFERMAYIVNSVDSYLELVPENVVISITDEHISDMLDKKQILNTNLKNGQDVLFNIKWDLTARHLVHVYSEKQLKRNLEVIKHITKRVIEMWNEVRKGKYVIREFCTSFLIKNLEARSYSKSAIESYPDVTITINRTILDMLQDALPIENIYLLKLQLRLSDITRNAVIAGKKEITYEEDNDQIVAAINTGVFSFADSLGSLVKEYIMSGNYFASFRDEIELCVDDKIRYIYTSLLNEHVVIHFDSDDLIVIMCTGLVKFNIPEIYLFILNILPLKYNGDWNCHQTGLNRDYENVLEIVKTLENDEVQKFLYEKFKR